MGCKSSKTEVKEPGEKKERGEVDEKHPLRPSVKPGYKADDANIAATGDGHESIDHITETVSHVLNRIVINLSLAPLRAAQP